LAKSGLARAQKHEAGSTLMSYGRCSIAGTMLEWDHKSRYGWAYDTWFNGKRLDQWIDADLRDALDQCWANFSSTETTEALWASIELFDKVSLRTASALGLTPFDPTPVRDEVARILGMRGR
jgi:aminoglycoside 6-adenylyltransferase